MATNWTMEDAFEVIKKNEDRAAVMDIIKRFPLAGRAMVLAAENEGASEIVRSLPTYITVRKIENGLKGEIDEDDVEEEKEEKVTPKKKPAKKRAHKKVEPEEDEDEEEEEEETPKKRSKKVPAKKSKKKPEPEEDEEDDDDDDWDI